MSLRINNNIAAINAHRNLTLTTRSLTSSMEKLSSGYRINRASDDPAGLVISEQFRAQIAGLGRAIQNSEGSINMIQTAEGSLNELNSLLIGMRELAIHAANEGFNDIDQLAADQAEIANAVATIDRIAANTQFGTKKLLDGSNANVSTITSINSTNLSIVESNLSTGIHSVAVTKVTDSTATINSTGLGVSLVGGTGSPDNLTDGIHNIDVIQASGQAEKLSADIDITDAWGKGISLDVLQTAAVQTATSAWAGASGSAIGDAGTAVVELNYQENGEAVTGNISLSADYVAGSTLGEIADMFTAAMVGTSLEGKVEATTDAVAGNTLVFQTLNSGANYSLMVNSWAGGTSAATIGGFNTGAANAERGVSLNRLNFTVNTAAGSSTADVDLATATHTTMASLNTALNTVLGTAFGVTGSMNYINSEVVSGENQLRVFSADEGSDYSIQMNTQGAEVYRLENTLNMSVDTIAHSGTNAIISFDGYRSDVSSVQYGAQSTQTIYNKDGDATTLGRGSIDLAINTAGNGIDIGNLLLDVSASTYSVSLDGAPGTAATGGLDSLVYNRDRTESLKVRVDLRSAGDTHTISATDQSLVFQIGANVGQTAKIGIRNMSASQLGRNIAGNMFTNLANIDVTTAQGAQDAQSVIDAAINEVSTTRGTLGSFQKNSLESNLRNLQIAKQNLSASESSIRDTDMAAEMSEFTKNQILLQAGISMLAQANQVPQTVLALFG